MKAETSRACEPQHSHLPLPVLSHSGLLDNSWGPSYTWTHEASDFGGPPRLYTTGVPEVAVAICRLLRGAEAPASIPLPPPGPLLKFKLSGDRPLPPLHQSRLRAPEALVWKWLLIPPARASFRIRQGCFFFSLAEDACVRTLIAQPLT